MMALTILEALWRASWQGGLALAVAWCITRLFSRAPLFISPGAKVWLWRAAYVKTIADLLVPGLALPILGTRFVLAPPPWVAMRLQREAAFAAQGSASGDSSLVVSALLALWIAGMAIAVARTLGAVAESRRMAMAAEPVEDRSLLWRYREMCCRLGVPKMPALLAGEVQSPALVGLVRQSIILPRHLVEGGCSSADMDAMLAHELIHSDRADLLWNCIVSLTGCVFFFHPLVRVGSLEHGLAQEMECDRGAADAAGHGVAAYGRMLVRVSAVPVTGWGDAFAAGMAAPELNLRWRLEALVGIRRTVAAAALSVLCVAAFAIWASPVRLTTREVVVSPPPRSAVAALRTVSPQRQNWPWRAYGMARHPREASSPAWSHRARVPQGSPWGFRSERDGRRMRPGMRMLPGALPGPRPGSPFTVPGRALFPDPIVVGFSFV